MMLGEVVCELCDEAMLLYIYADPMTCEMMLFYMSIRTTCVMLLYEYLSDGIIDGSTICDMHDSY